MSWKECNYGNRQTNSMFILYLCRTVYQRSQSRPQTLLPALQKYKPRARVRYKNQKKEKLEKIRRNEKYD